MCVHVFICMCPIIKQAATFLSIVIVKTKDMQCARYGTVTNVGLGTTTLSSNISVFLVVALCDGNRD